MDTLGSNLHAADPLARRLTGRLLVASALLVAVAVFAASAGRDDRAPLPGVALGSPLLLDLERALLAAALFAAAAIFAIRGWSGYFPAKFSATGAEYVTAAEELAADVRELDRCQAVAARNTERSYRELAARYDELRASLADLAQEEIEDRL